MRTALYIFTIYSKIGDPFQIPEKLYKERLLFQEHIIICSDATKNSRHWNNYNNCIYVGTYTLKVMIAQISTITWDNIFSPFTFYGTPFSLVEKYIVLCRRYYVRCISILNKCLWHSSPKYLYNLLLCQIFYMFIWDGWHLYMLEIF